MRTLLRLAPGLCLLGCLALPAEARTIADWQFEEGSDVVFLNSAVGGRERNNGVLINQLGYMSFQFDDSERFSLFFDGIDDIGVVPDSKSLRPRRAMSLEAWINHRLARVWLLESKSVFFLMILSIPISLS
jgi:hypothetical protein